MKKNNIKISDKNLESISGGMSASVKEINSDNLPENYSYADITDGSPAATQLLKKIFGHSHSEIKIIATPKELEYLKNKGYI